MTAMCMSINKSYFSTVGPSFSHTYPLYVYSTICHSLTHIHCMYTVTILHNMSFSHTYPLYVYCYNTSQYVILSHISTVCILLQYFTICHSLTHIHCMYTPQYVILSHISTVCILLQYSTICHSLTHIHCMYTVTILHNTSFSHTYPLYVYCYNTSQYVILSHISTVCILILYVC